MARSEGARSDDGGGQGLERRKKKKNRRTRSEGSSVDSVEEVVEKVQWYEDGKGTTPVPPPTKTDQEAVVAAMEADRGATQLEEEDFRKAWGLPGPDELVQAEDNWGNWTKDGNGDWYTWGRSWDSQRTPWYDEEGEGARGSGSGSSGAWSAPRGGLPWRWCWQEGR